MRWAGVLAALGLTAVAPAARADLDGDAQELATHWKKSAEVRRLTPHLIERGSVRPWWSWGRSRPASC
jgi:hypothetical protein